MKIFFVGTVSFSEKTLIKLLSLNVNLVGVATKSKSSFNSDHVDLSYLCNQHEIPYKYVRDINAPHIVDWIQTLNPDIIFVFGWSSLIKKSLLAVPSMGILGFHPAALPENRGRHPIIWAIALGLSSTASTFFFMDEGADSGDILSQKEVKILYEDDAQSLYEKIINAACSQIEEFIPLLQNKTYIRVKQKDEQANYWRKRGMADGQIDFRMSSRAIYNLVRSLTHPYVGAHIINQDKEIKVWKVSEVVDKRNNFEPGKVLAVEDQKIIIKTSDGAIKLEEHEFDSLPKIDSYL